MAVLLFKEGDIIIVHGESFSLTVTDDGGTGDNHTCEQICPTDNITFSSGQQLMNGDVISLSDAAVTTFLNANVSRANSTDNISLASTVGLAVGQTLLIDDGTEAAADSVVISKIHSASAVEVTGIATDTTQPYLSGAVVTRAVVSDTCTLGAAKSSTTVAVCTLTTGNLDFSDSMVATVIRPYEQLIVDNVTSSTVLVTTASATRPHKSGSSVTLLSFPEIRHITARDAYSLTLNSALVYPHHNGAAVTKVATGRADFTAGELDEVLVGDIVIIDKDGDEATVLDRIEGTIAAVVSGNGGTGDTPYAVITPNTATTEIITIDANNANVKIITDAVKVTGAQDSSGNAQQTNYGRYAGLNATGTDDTDVDRGF